MSPTAISSLSTVLKREGVAIANIKGISGPSLSRDTADVTTLDAPNGFEQIIPTVLRSGDVTFTLVFDTDNQGHLDLRDDIVSATERNFDIVIPATAASGTVQTHNFNAYVTGYSNQMEVGSEVTAEVTIKPTGGITATEV